MNKSRNRAKTLLLAGLIASSVPTNGCGLVDPAAMADFTRVIADMAVQVMEATLGAFMGAEADEPPPPATGADPGVDVAEAPADEGEEAAGDETAGDDTGDDEVAGDLPPEDERGGLPPEDDYASGPGRPLPPEDDTGPDDWVGSSDPDPAGEYVVFLPGVFGAGSSAGAEGLAGEDAGS